MQHSLVVWIVSLLFATNTNMLCFTPTLNTQQNVLPDVLHSLMTHDDGTQFIDDTVCDLMLLPLLLLLLSCLWYAKSSRSRCMVISELMIVHSVLVVVRGVLINVTTLPSPIHSCLDTSIRPQSYLLTIYCNDQIFSGHTTVNLIAMSAVEFNTVYVSRSIKVIGWLYVVAASIVSIASRDHYTVDVLLAWTHTCGLMWLRRSNFEKYWNDSGVKEDEVEKNGVKVN